MIVPKVLMYDGSLKERSSLVVGDTLMGHDSTLRVIKEIKQGLSQLYEITPKKGHPFVISEKEKLFLSRSKNSHLHMPESVDVLPTDYGDLNKPFKARYCLTKSKVEFSNNKELVIPPYILGIWLGDGTSINTNITTMDDEIHQEYKKYGESLGLIVRASVKKGRAFTYTATMGKGSNTRKHLNEFLNNLNGLHLINNKHIPFPYLTSLRKDRLELLAGLIDTDGSLAGNNTFEISQKNTKLAEAIVYLARSVGLAAYPKTSVKSCQTGVSGIYQRILISGDTSIIPVRLPRKKSKPYLQIKNPLKTGITLCSFGEQDYTDFIFEEKETKYLDENFIVRNCLT